MTINDVIILKTTNIKIRKKKIIALAIEKVIIALMNQILSSGVIMKRVIILKCYAIVHSMMKVIAATYQTKMQN